MFAVIDGHTSKVVAEFIKEHFWALFYRNRNIMVRKRFKKGLKQFFIQVEKLILSDYGQKWLKQAYGEPRSIFEKDPRETEESRSPSFKSGACMTVIITNSDSITIANIGDSKAVMSAEYGQSNVISKDHVCRDKPLLGEAIERSRTTNCGYHVSKNDQIVYTDP